jgi:DNA-binding transcriptional MocR family regulator
VSAPDLPDAEPPLRDLASGYPDPLLLPPLRPALDAIDLSRQLVDNVDSVVPALLEVARQRYAEDGVPDSHVAVFSSALDAMERILLAHTRPGASVLVEDPGYPPVYFLVAALGLKTVPVAVDAEGMVPEAVAELAGGAAALIMSPRAQNPTGAVTTPERAAALRAVLAPHPGLLTIEDDHAGDVAGPGYATLADPERGRWAVVRSASKSLGSDLRLAVVAADSATGTKVRGRQRRGPGWTSGLLQQAVLHQWTDPAALAALRAAKAAYAERRDALVAALAAHGIEATGRSGLNVWVPVADEDAVVARLHDAGFRISAGVRFRRNSPTAVRVTVSTLLPEEAGHVAGLIAEAVAAAEARRDRAAGSRVMEGQPV